MDDMELPSPVPPSSIGLGRHSATATPSPSLILSADDIRAGRILSPFQRRLDGSTPPFALKRVHSIQRAGSAMSDIDITLDGSTAPMAKRSRSTTTPREPGLATQILHQTSSQSSGQLSGTLPTLEEERPDATDFPIPNLDAGLGQSNLTGRGALASQSLKRRIGNRSQRQDQSKSQPEPSALTTMARVWDQSSAKFERDENRRTHHTTLKTALEAQSLLSPRRNGLNQDGAVHLDAEADMNQKWTSLYDWYVWEELREKLFGDVDRVSDDDMTLQLLVDKYERDLAEQIRDMSRS
ncbi:hypothetical protein DL546_009506 [Coniochaeta pulveracea]|uniref:Uncharacterized protein n=1 Tax=Coniochaeta pulveracea TaxID=177199 RepID=A0A420YLH6_9PEZI|nr:hypothetical protein DL546_009506 [Coniochaeta pulveracea]